MHYGRLCTSGLVSWKRWRSVRKSTSFARCGDNAIDALSYDFHTGGTLLRAVRGKKARQETLKRVLKNAKTFVRDLSSEVLRAKEPGQRRTSRPTPSSCTRPTRYTA